MADSLELQFYFRSLELSMPSKTDYWHTNGTANRPLTTDN